MSLFSDREEVEYERVIYENNPLARVAGRINYYTQLRISQGLPADFHDEIREDFQMFTKAGEMEDSELETFRFLRESGTEWIHLTPEWLELRTSEYNRWEPFRDRLLETYSALNASYDNVVGRGVELMYFDGISPSEIDDESIGDWRDVLAPHVAGPIDTLLDADSVTDHGQSTDAVLDEEEDDQLELTIELNKPAEDSDERMVFIIIHVRSAVHNPGREELEQELHRLHQYPYPIFRDCTTDKLHEALGPQQVS